MFSDNVCQREDQVWGPCQARQGALWQRDDELHSSQGKEEEEVQGPQCPQETPVCVAFKRWNIYNKKVKFFSYVCKAQINNLIFSLPRSAFFIFCSDFRPKVKGDSPGLSIGEVAKKLGVMWNGTSAEDKQPYEKKASKLKEKYEKVSRL